MEVVKCVIITTEILLSIWILYRSGRILLNKGDADARTEAPDDDFVIVMVFAIAYLSSLSKANFISWIVFYCAMFYDLVYIIFKIEKVITKIFLIIFWVFVATIFPFIK